MKLLREKTTEIVGSFCFFNISWYVQYGKKWRSHSMTNQVPPGLVVQLQSSSDVFSVKTFRGCNKVFTPREPSKMDEMRLHGLALKLQVDCIDWFLIHVYFVVTQVEHLISILSIRSCLNPEIYDEVWGVKENRTSPIAVMLKLSSVWLHVLKLTIFKMFLGLSRSYQESLVALWIQVAALNALRVQFWG